MYYAFQHLEDGDRFVEVEGRKVKFTGFEDFEFFYYKSTGNYCILEARSGMSAGIKGTLKEALELARGNLARAGAANLKKIVDEEVKNHGLSPKYKGV